MVVATDKKYDPQERIAIPFSAIVEQTKPLVDKALKKLKLIPITGETERRGDYLPSKSASTSKAGPRSKEFERRPEDMVRNLERDQYKTSMTTNLKNVTRRQKKDMLTTSSRLLHTGVLKGMEEEKKEQGASKVLLRPSSSYALVKHAKIGDQEEVKRVDQLTIQGARQREIVTPKWNSYKVMPSQYTKIYTNKSNIFYKFFSA